MVLIDGEIVVFDGIEFNAALSFVDVMSEIAFLLMDLEVRASRPRLDLPQPLSGGDGRL